jgi:hypothetical protein
LEDVINVGLKPKYTQPILGRPKNKKKKKKTPVLILSLGSLSEQVFTFLFNFQKNILLSHDNIISTTGLRIHSSGRRETFISLSFSKMYRIKFQTRRASASE